MSDRDDEFERGVDRAFEKFRAKMAPYLLELTRRLDDLADLYRRSPIDEARERERLQ